MPPLLPPNLFPHVSSMANLHATFQNLLHHPFGQVFPCYSPMFNEVAFR
jgi:hypothetical protein